MIIFLNYQRVTMENQWKSEFSINGHGFIIIQVSMATTMVKIIILQLWTINSMAMVSMCSFTRYEDSTWFNHEKCWLNHPKWRFTATEKVWDGTISQRYHMGYHGNSSIWVLASYKLQIVAIILSYFFWDTHHHFYIITIDTNH